MNDLPQNLPFESEEFKTIWNEWVEFRKQQKFPSYKPIGLKRTLAGLLEDSDGDERTAIKMIENAIKNTWRGIFKIKVDVRNNNNTKPGTSAARIEVARSW